MSDLAEQREHMVREQIAGRGIFDAHILEAFRTVPRESFVAAEFSGQAYEDHPLPIEAGQTISQPYIVALMIQAARIGESDRVLEVGAGSGYAAAVIGRIAREVVAVERHSELAQLAEERLERLGYGNVRIVHGDGTGGCPDAAPFDAILAAAAGEEIPRALVDQLADGGRLVMPVGSPGGIQELVRLTKRSDGGLDRQELGAVRFVPLVGEGPDG
jgi:protein-L-isoaspartate(D-aspartate) O-methyltransferase